MREWITRLFDWMRRDRLERELTDELEFHRRMLERDAIAGGATRQQAIVESRRRLGSATRVHEQARERWSWPVLDVLQQDVRYALRGLRRAPGFTAAVVLTLSLGIGANAAMFGVIDRLMFRPLGLLRDPGSVNRVFLRSMEGREPRTTTWVSAGRYRDMVQGTSSFSQFATFDERTVGVHDGEVLRERRIGAVSASFFSFFDARPVLGRVILEEDDQPPAGSDVVVLGYDLWQSEFGGASDVLGRRLRVGMMDARIIGVAPRGLAGVNDADPPSLFIPSSAGSRVRGLPVRPGQLQGYDLTLGGMLVRRKPGVTEERASADLTQAFVRS